MQEKKYEINWEKYHRNTPIKEFDLNQTMYSLVTNESKKDLRLHATGFMGNSMTYGDLIASSDDLAQAFYNAGVREGDKVTICTISMPIVQQSLLSLSKIGATMCWIDLRTKEKDLIKYINNGECKTIIVFEEMLPLIESIINETDLKKVIISSPKDCLSPMIRVLATLKDKKEGKKIVVPDDERFVRFSDFLNEGKKTQLINPVSFEKDRPSLIVQSSGSTGKPKQIVHTEYNFNSAVQKMAYSDLPFYKGTTMHISIPPFIIYGLGNSIYASMAFTMKAEMNPYVSENTVYDDLGKFDISLAAPLHYRYIYNKLLELEKDISILEQDTSSSAKIELKQKFKELKRVLDGIQRAKAFVSGGDKIGTEELIAMQQKFNTIIVNGYGNNECLGASVVSPMYANKPGSIGVPMHGVDVKIVDPETEEILSPFNVGELYVSSDNLFVEYLGNDAETRKIKVFDEEGKPWVRTGDLCYIDEDGYIVPKGRNRRVIKKEAFKISPDTIEETICLLPFVKECVVVGVGDEKSLSVPMAFIVLSDETIFFEDVLQQIKDKCIEDLPDYEVPSYFQQIDKIPYTPNDKQDFLTLEKLGNEIVQNNRGVVLKKQK
ncbi:MAG: class I adenylate-forming enzyme family protein [bacterium]|nr:class I adenylate-forming enzyme family protein [bacterium]